MSSGLRSKVMPITTMITETIIRLKEDIKACYMAHLSYRDQQFLGGYPELLADRASRPIEWPGDQHDWFKPNDHVLKQDSNVDCPKSK